jgi:hypothetical protein
MRSGRTQSVHPLAPGTITQDPTKPSIVDSTCIIHSGTALGSTSRVRDPGGRSLPMSSAAQLVKWYGGAIVIGSSML